MKKLITILYIVFITVAALICTVFLLKSGPAKGFFYEQLNLKTPEAAVEQFCNAYSKADYVTVFFVFSNDARSTILEYIMRVRFETLVEQELFSEFMKEEDFDLLSTDFEQGPTAMFMFARILSFADEHDALSLQLGPLQKIIESDRVQSSGDKNEVHRIKAAVGESEHPVTFFLDQTPSERWRVNRVVYTADEEGTTRNWP